MACNARPAIDCAAIYSLKLTGIASARQINEALFGRSVVFIEHNICKYGDLGTRMFAIPGSWIIPGTAHPVERDFVSLEVGRVLGHKASFPIDNGT
jgi:hypothetical protein